MFSAPEGRPVSTVPPRSALEVFLDRWAPDGFGVDYDVDVEDGIPRITLHLVADGGTSAAEAFADVAARLSRDFPATRGVRVVRPGFPLRP